MAFIKDGACGKLKSTGSYYAAMVASGNIIPIHDVVMVQDGIETNGKLLLVKKREQKKTNPVFIKGTNQIVYI